MNKSDFHWFALLAISFIHSAFAQTPPAGFTNTPVGSDWVEPVGLTFADDGRLFVWEKAGKVWVVENEVKASVPFLDISEEVGNWRDHGLLGFALDPDFTTNGYFYLLYVVDRYYLKNAGTPAYSDTTNEYLNATIGRLTRYTANAADNFHTIDPTSRTVLIGETISTGIPILGTSHGLGSLVFGSDNTLLVSCGDGGSASALDSGSVQSSYYQQALADSIILPQQNVGAFRAQQVDALNGKILRIDPLTGNGIASNPFYDPAAPRSARSRVWALGLRNPFRMTRRPGTGSANPADGNPGVLYVGDVGWNTWEEMDIVNEARLNFGWPLFEGLEPNESYRVIGNLSNKVFPNPLYNTNNCAEQFFSFSDLLKQATLDPNFSFTNPCNAQEQLPAGVPHFFHARPAFDWKSTGSPVSRTGSFKGYEASVDTMGISSAVIGNVFKGNCSVGGVWYTGNSFPSEYRNGYFHADYGQGWIRFFQMDGLDKPVKVTQFINSKANVVGMAIHPQTGDLYYVNLGPQTPYPQEVRKVSYVEQLPDEVSLYPNPAAEAVTLIVKGYAQVRQVNIRVYNQTGQQVFDQHITRWTDEPNVISLHSLSKGLYYLQLQLDKEAIVKKLVVQ